MCSLTSAPSGSVIMKYIVWIVHERRRLMMCTKLSGFTFIGFIDARIDTLKNVKPFYKYAINKAIYKNTESLFLISDYYYFF